MFSVILLGKKLSPKKWLALFGLFVGVALVQLPAGSGAPPPPGGGNVVVGLVAVLMACCSSAFAGVYFERILKKKSGSLWLRNIQLGLFGVGFGVVGAYGKDGAAIAAGGFLQHYGPDVWVVVLLQALSGLIIASVIKYADNILKTFANGARPPSNTPATKRAKRPLRSRYGRCVARLAVTPR